MKRRSQAQRAETLAVLRDEVLPLERPDALESIVRWIGDARIVLLGEGTHGTREFYAWRARLTRQLIEQAGFSAVAVEADWPDAFHVNRYVQARADLQSAEQALATFQRFPAWMWRNVEVAEFITGLREWNDQRSAEAWVGFYGLDLYSLHASMRAVVAYLEAHDPAAARAARANYACFDQFGPETETYAWATARMGEQTCEEAVTRQLVELSRQRYARPPAEDITGLEEFFSAEQNARLARNAERYYRTLFRGRVESWNVRDEHMADTLDQLCRLLEQQNKPGKVVVWAHNSHLGDARATQMGEEGEWNLGQLARERHGDAVRSIGFTTYTGSVLAARDWGDAGLARAVRPALEESCETLFHEVGVPAFFLPLRDDAPAATLLRAPQLQRAIGVVYRPETERHSHYFSVRLPAQFDAVIHFDTTHAITPLGLEARREDEIPETFPSGM